MYSRHIIDDAFISNKHLRIYTIIFDRENINDNNMEVPPLVYVQDLSRNGTLWNGFPMGKGSGSFLLSDGDRLTLTENRVLVFRQTFSSGGGNGFCFDDSQRAEMEVCISPSPSLCLSLSLMYYDIYLPHAWMCNII